MARNATRLVIAAALVFPTLATWLYYIALPEGPARQVAFVTLKVVQFGFPLVWAFLILKRRWHIARPTWGDVCEGVATGAVIAGLMLVGYYALLRDGPMFAQAGRNLAAKMQSFGVASFAAYASMAAFYCVVHSLLEEYYWRWFVFGELTRIARLSTAIVVSSLGFMAHHVLVVGEFFGNYGLATWLASAAVAVGGGIWAWAYQRRGSLYAPWISHALVDAGLMWIGWDTLHRAWGA